MVWLWKFFGFFVAIYQIYFPEQFYRIILQINFTVQFCRLYKLHCFGCLLVAIVRKKEPQCLEY